MKASLAEHDDLFEAGMSSHAGVKVMLALRGERLGGLVHIDEINPDPRCHPLGMPAEAEEPRAHPHGLLAAASP
jgi:hypothetical protein